MTIDYDPSRSLCPIATALDIVGDKWSMVIIRDMLSGKSKFSEFLASPEGIKKNILNQRLKRLVELGLVRRRQYESRPPRFEYVLSQAGADLLPVLQELAKWSHRHVCGLWTPSKAYLNREIPVISE